MATTTTGARRPARGAAGKAASKSHGATKRGARRAPADPAGRYTDPALRERLKRRILAGDKGGRAGQWSARKAQLLAHEYEARGGGYVGPKSEAARHLDAWTREDWRTADGRPARRGGTTARYLPKQAWEELTPAERRATDKKKRAASKAGRQFAANTGRAAEARRHATEGERAAAAPAREAAKRPAAKAAAAKRTAAKRAAAKAAGAKRPATTRPAAKAAAKSAAAKRPATKRAAAKRATAKRATAKRATAKRATAKRATAKRATAKRATAKRAPGDRAAATRPRS